MRARRRWEFLAERASWYRDPETAVFIEAELKRGIYRGIGEFHLDGTEADSPVIRRIVELAAALDPEWKFREGVTCKKQIT